MTYLSVPINQSRADYLERREEGAPGGPALDAASDKISASITHDFLMWRAKKSCRMGVASCVIK